MHWRTRGTAPMTALTSAVDTFSPCTRGAHTVKRNAMLTVAITANHVLRGGLAKERRLDPLN
eukprot:2731858-Pleurochrysis_carterae.AAC.1